MVQYWLYRMAAFLSRGFPHGLTYWVGLRIADAYYYFGRASRQAVVNNLRRVLQAQSIRPGERALRGLARKTFQYFGKYLIDFFRYSKLTRAQVDRLISLQHLEHVDQALALGRGVLMITAHFGNWELGGGVMAALGYKVNAIALPARVKRLERLFARQRARRGLQVIPLGQSGFAIMRCLRRGELVALLGDRDFTNSTERVPFFGVPARIPLGPARLAMKTGAPIVPGFLIRQVDDTFLLRLYPPILPEVEGSAERIRQKLCAILEKEIGERPYQWFIFNDFWGEGPLEARAPAPVPEGEAAP